jgi:hypothetical protein
MTSSTRPLKIQRVDARSGSVEILAELREKLSPRGDIVSPRGRALTEEVFGKPLTPTEVVQTICETFSKRAPLPCSVTRQPSIRPNSMPTSFA